MFDTLQTKPMLGSGIYTVPDMALILGLPYSKINRWLNTFWNDKLGQKYGLKYSWDVDFTKAVNFYTLIEIYTFYQLHQSGVTTKEILGAHEILSAQFNTPYPFANKIIIDSLRTDGKKVIFERKDGVIYSVDIHKQTYLNFIKEFFKNLDFGSDCLAIRLWPLGKNKAIVCDPHHQFGQPTISGTNILADIVSDMYKSGDSIKFIANTYGVKIQHVKDAIEYASKAA
jgi:uncharacterized protein (DUF433 family)